ncbi:hypothetical protein ACJQWK_10117 [Exserohilum turcicum]|uniref:Zn(2)-C6 fungal-type domain-containing protein n=1 Tax=Exserohilum turcicum (strain 28A) TaxID=671987 RepID=R0KDT5_EXST2|nr:uncharacterized protein SETTUDRAFT_163409 [Exserohilum turcica Et28A]EOA87499.1 hypothetical protein SETTUDRAFT_163409 [Exserohilum turcica Et28A]
MAASPQSPSPSTTVLCRYTPAPERFRLRNSCNSCASSKLKCPREKPICSRCAQRRLTCKYLPAKPRGKKANGPSIGSEPRSSQPRHACTCLQAQVESAVPSSSNTEGSSCTIISNSSSFIHDLFPSPDDVSSSASGTTQIDFGDYFPTPVSDRTDMDMLREAHNFSTSINGSSMGSDERFDTFPPFSDAISELFTVSIPNPTPETSMQFGMEPAQSYQAVGPNDSPHSCLNRALRSLEQISSISYQEEAAASTTVGAIVTESKAAIQTIQTTLTCTCSQDGYSLVIIAFVVLKVLDLYAAAARHGPSFHHDRGPESRSPSVSDHVLPNTATIGNYCLEGADSARMAAQLVLNELHLVRRVVGKLSSALKKQAATGEGQAEVSTQDTLSSDVVNERALPFSLATYDDLAIDLVKRCKTLSLGIINQLREL